VHGTYRNADRIVTDTLTGLAEPVRVVLERDADALQGRGVPPALTASVMAWPACSSDLHDSFWWR
jgi:hypothetical protein